MTAPRRGAVDPAVVAELPGLRLDWTMVAASPGPTGPGLRRRLRELSDRSRGIDAVALRTRPVPRAYRAMFRQIGLDPDVERIPAEAAAVARLMHGGLRATERVADACLVALVETGVPVWALDGAAVGDGLGIRLRSGGLVVADDRTVHAVLFGDPSPASAPGPRTSRVVLFSVAAPGVPEIHVDEALWLAAEELELAEPA